MPRTTLLATALAALAGCATVPRPVEPLAAAPAEWAPLRSDTPRDAGDAPRGAAGGAAPEGGGEGEPRARRDGEVQSRLVDRAVALLGRRGPFRAGRERFRDDCSGFVAAVYAAGGLDLRGELQQAAPQGRRGAAGLWLAAQARGTTFGPEESPEPGDLVFWNDTYDRNRNRRTDDPFTHVGIVERVDDGTVVFLHRGARGVARGFMTLARRHDARDAAGRKLNSTIRARAHPARGGGLAAELFAGFAVAGLPRGDR